MQHIFLCDDNTDELNLFSKIIKDTVMMEQLNMKLNLATSDPYELLDCIKESKDVGIYILDINLKADITGLELAERIRVCDPRGYIVFITTHAEMSYLTFVYKVEALDFIIKTADTNFQQRIRESLLKINERHIASIKDKNKGFTLKIDDMVISVPFDKILFFETSTTIHKVVLHGTDRQMEFYSSLKNVEQQLDERFYKCKASCIVNKDLIERIDVKRRLIHMRNGECCYASTRLLKGLLV